MEQFSVPSSHNSAELTPDPPPAQPPKRDASGHILLWCSDCHQWKRKRRFTLSTTAGRCNTCQGHNPGLGQHRRSDKTPTVVLDPPFLKGGRSLKKAGDSTRAGHEEPQVTNLSEVGEHGDVKGRQLRQKGLDPASGAHEADPSIDIGRGH